MSLPLLHQLRLRDTSVGVGRAPQFRGTEKLNSSLSGTQPTRPTKSAKDETLNDPRTCLRNGSLAECRQEGPQVGDDMVIGETDSDETEADNSKGNDAENRSTQWFILFKRKPNRKIEAKLRMAALEARVGAELSDQLQDLQKAQLAADGRQRLLDEVEPWSPTQHCPLQELPLLRSSRDAPFRWTLSGYQRLKVK
ncbi:hypothetical protein HPB51_019025 [Rhipicephalus microplus]|uniref:Uncharacterized protein n=1 Tax=Rhipicephalus microplus TaxID=6941 RepID=A0A9J6D6Q0_RHIMP|nr:hypothetical protein HPB51_019025 [Rhipicephalus microplus]